jgi:hypothetical protein
MNEMEGNFFEFSMDEMPNEIFNIYHEVLKTKIFSSTQYNCQVHALSSTIGQGMYYPSDYTAAQLLSEGNITHKDGYVIRYYDNMNEAKSSHLKRRTYYFEDTENSYSITLKCEPNHFDYIAGIVDESVKCID